MGLEVGLVADIANCMNNLNLKLQGKENLVCDLYAHLKVFRCKLDLFLKQVKLKKVTHFEKSQIFMQKQPSTSQLHFLMVSFKIAAAVSGEILRLDSTADEGRRFQNPFEAGVAIAQIHYI